MANQNNRRAKIVSLQSMGRAISCSMMAAFPLCGLVLFFEMTRPAAAPIAGALALKSPGSSFVGGGSFPATRVARFEGVSAELKDAIKIAKQPEKFGAPEALAAFAEASSPHLQVGFESEFVAGNGRRVFMRVIRCDPAGDQTVPDNSKALTITPASTARVVSFVWDGWRYSVEIDDQKRQPHLAVQNSL